MKRAKSELLPGTLDMLVLKTLCRGPQHGYAIARHIQRVSQDVLSVEEGSLYPALHRLERRGFVEAEWGQSESNRRAKYYQITEPGRAQLQAQQQGWEQMSNAIASILQACGAAS